MSTDERGPNHVRGSDENKGQSTQMEKKRDIATEQSRQRRNIDLVHGLDGAQLCYTEEQQGPPFGIRHVPDARLIDFCLSFLTVIIIAIVQAERGPKITNEDQGPPMLVLEAKIKGGA